MKSVAMIEEFIARKRISMKAGKIASNPVIGLDDCPTGVVHYKCSLYGPEGRMEAYLSFSPESGQPNLPDVMVMLAMDASGCEMLDGFSEFRNELTAEFGGSDGNLKEIEEFWREYQGRCRQVAALRDFLGEADYLELMEHFDPDADGMDILAASNM